VCVCSDCLLESIKFISAAENKQKIERQRKLREVDAVLAFDWPGACFVCAYNPGDRKLCD